MPGGYANIDGNVEGKQFSEDYQPDEKWTEEKALQLGNELIAWLKKTDKDNDGNERDRGNILLNEFLVIERDLYPQLITYLRDKYSSFKKLYERAKKIQEIKLVKYGIADRLNASMTKFTLINNHDWMDKSEVASKHSGGIDHLLKVEYVKPDES